MAEERFWSNYRPKPVRISRPCLFLLLPNWRLEICGLLPNNMPVVALNLIKWTCRCHQGEMTRLLNNGDEEKICAHSSNVQEACVNLNHCDVVLIWYIYSVSELNTFYGDNTALIGNTLSRKFYKALAECIICTYIGLLTNILICIPVFRFVRFTY